MIKDQALCSNCKIMVNKSDAINFPPATSHACPKCKGLIIFNEFKKENFVKKKNKPSDSIFWFFINIYLVISYVIFIFINKFEILFIIVGGMIILDPLTRLFLYIFTKQKDISDDALLPQNKEKYFYKGTNAYRPSRRNRTFGEVVSMEIPIEFDFIKILLSIIMSIYFICKFF